MIALETEVLIMDGSIALVAEIGDSPFLSRFLFCRQLGLARPVPLPTWMSLIWFYFFFLCVIVPFPVLCRSDSISFYFPPPPIILCMCTEFLFPGSPQVRSLLEVVSHVLGKWYVVRLSLVRDNLLGLTVSSPSQSILRFLYPPPRHFGWRIVFSPPFPHLLYSGSEASLWIWI